MITIDDFWRIDDQIKARWGKNFYKYIDYCGLVPVRPLQNYGYFCTPKNSLTFATTCGDGVHFGIMKDKNGEINVGPVIMTVPMFSKNNIVIAGDLDEFFSLGYYVGWFALEQIVYDIDETIDYYSRTDSDPEMEKEEYLFLEIIRKELPINHKPLSKERLKELEQRYFDRLEIGSV